MKKIIVCAMLLGAYGETINSTEPTASIEHPGKRVLAYKMLLNRGNCEVREPLYRPGTGPLEERLSGKYFEGDPKDVDNLLSSLPQEASYRVEECSNRLFNIEVRLSETEYDTTKKNFIRKNEGYKEAKENLKHWKGKEPKKDLHPIRKLCTWAIGIGSSIISAEGLLFFAKKLRLITPIGLSNICDISRAARVDKVIVGGVALASILAGYLIKSYVAKKEKKVKEERYEKWETRHGLAKYSLGQARGDAKKSYGQLFTFATITDSEDYFYYAIKRRLQDVCMINEDSDFPGIEVFKEAESGDLSTSSPSKIWKKVPQRSEDDEGNGAVPEHLAGNFAPDPDGESS